jgi:putative membrane protein
MTLLLGLAWWALLYGVIAVKPWVVMWGRIMRDAGAEALPLSQVGGFVLGARALVLHGVDRRHAAASTIVDLTAELCSQVAYTGLGALVLLWIRPQTTLGRPLLIGVLATVPLLSAIVMVQQRGAMLLDRFKAPLAGAWLAALAAGVVAVQAEIRAIYSRPAAFSCCFLLHFVGWLVLALESWLALRLMAAPIGFVSVLVIESLLYAIRGLAFAVPNAIGVQEGAYVMLGASFGLSPDIALGLSLLKRGRDLLLGLPALMIWQLVESRRVLVR